MAITCNAYRDAKGVLHADLDQATVADIAAVLKDGLAPATSGGMAHAIAKTIFAKRAEIERIFSEHDGVKS